MSADETVALPVENDTGRAILVQIEPWGDEFPLLPGERITIRLRGRGVSLSLVASDEYADHEIRVIEGRWLSGPGNARFPVLQVLDADGKPSGVG